MSNQIKTAAVHPVIPKVGALIRVKETGVLQHFKDWKTKTTVTLGDDKVYKADEVEALTPAHYGLIHERAVAMPDSGHGGTILSVRQWRNLNPIVVFSGESRSRTFSPNMVAALAPLLNPATETKDAKLERLEREQKVLVEGLHARMVAEGVARSWCTEFDGILDSTGLPPRAAKNVIEGTMTFRWQYNGEITEDLLKQVRARWQDYIPTRDVRLSDVRVPDNSIVGPVLS